MTENVSLTSARLPKYVKQANSADLVRHRQYGRCVICEERTAKQQQEAGITTWWTCKKCEEAK